MSEELNQPGDVCESIYRFGYLNDGNSYYEIDSYENSDAAVEIPSTDS